MCFSLFLNFLFLEGSPKSPSVRSREDRSSAYTNSYPHSWSEDLMIPASLLLYTGIESVISCESLLPVSSKEIGLIMFYTTFSIVSIWEEGASIKLKVNGYLGVTEGWIFEVASKLSDSEEYYNSENNEIFFHILSNTLLIRVSQLFFLQISWKV